MTKKTEPSFHPKPNAELPIDVGHHAEDVESGFRLWCAREALRQGELRIAGQMASVAAMMGRAASSLGWTITLALALAAASTATHFSWGTAGALACLLLAAVGFAAVLWPRWWGVPGDDPTWIMSKPYETELEIVEALAIRSAMASTRNERGIARLSRRFRFGTVLLVAAIASALTWSVVERGYLPGLVAVPSVQARGAVVGQP